MTPEQMQQIAEREYPVDTRDPFTDYARIGKTRAIFKHGLTYSKWIALEDGCNMPEDDVAVNVTFLYRGKEYTGTARYHIGQFKTVSLDEFPRHFTIIAWQSPPEPYKK